MVGNGKVNTPLKSYDNTVRFAWNWRIMAYLGIIAFIILATIFLPPHYHRLLIEMMIFALLAMSLDLLIGFTGIISFGHGAFFGLSIYITGLLVTSLGFPFLLSAVVAIILTVLVATLIGWFCVRLSGIQFAMLTLAFGMLIWTIITKWRDVTHGLDGFSVLQGLSIQLGGWELPLTNSRTLMIVTAVVLMLSYWSMRKLVNSNFGQLLLAVRENENRTSFLGFSNTRIKLQIFIISAFYASVAGVLFLLLKAFVSPEYLHWSYSGNILMMTILGGMGTLLGPLLGAGLFIWFQ